RLGAKDNFWMMGEIGPCGPCSEILYDHGEEFRCGPRCGLGTCDCGRYVELWNLVFMQFNRDGEGRLTPLPKPSVDTGAGLERLAAALQGTVSNYDTDLFRPLIDHAAELTGKDYGEEQRTDMALRVIADHSRAAAFVVGDGVLPSNESRGYVLRKIIRRAIDYGRQLGLEKPFLFEMVGRVAELMREPYPELLESVQRIATVVKAEEEKYARLVVPAVRVLEKEISESQSRRLVLFPKTGVVEPAAEVTGEILFFAYDTLGLRPDFVRDLAQERGWRIDEGADKDFQTEMNRQRERAKASWKGAAKQAASLIYQMIAGGTFSYPLPTGGVTIIPAPKTVFEGYTQTEAVGCRILAIVDPGAAKGKYSLDPGSAGEIILDRTPFYAEAGGQVGDTGWLYDQERTTVLAEVTDCYYPVQGVHIHRVLARQTLNVGDRVKAVVNEEARWATMRNHTGTHLLHAALRQVLGPHVKQAGSLVAPDRLRFDFAHYAALDPEELKEIERLANLHILRDAPVTEERLNLDAALHSGALAFFGDKYPEKNVRVITVPDPEDERGFYSKELCGGTHVTHTGQIGVLKVVSESSVAAGVRRVEALTGEEALVQYQQAQERLKQLAEALHVPESEVPAAVERLAQQARQLEKELQATRRRSAHQQVDELVERVRRVKDVGVLAAVVEDVDRETMRTLVDTLRQKLGSGVIVLGTTSNGKVALITAVTKDLTKKLHAGKIVKEVASRVGGSGGGRADLAEAGGKEPEHLREALEDVYRIVEKML
ncbi:MAG TPA: alanine--tRNA ligase, partial [Candidatus Acidoferrales bacterium]|nr:alanine--tRNA ligase [Candidatus Acidoferrales bacterium]